MESLASLETLLASADAVVWSRGSAVAEHPTLAPREILDRHPHLTVTAITPFGLEGPWSDKPATEFTLQAWSGGVVGLARGRPDRAPVFVGGQIGEWVAGVFGAIATLAAGRRADPGGELIDLSMLESLAMTLTYYPVTFNDQLGRPMRRKRFVPTPGVGAASDGLVGLGCGTGQQWLDFCAMVEHPEWMDDPKLFLDRTALDAGHRRLDRRPYASRRSSTWRRPSGSPMHRSPTVRTSRRSSTSGSGRPSCENPRDGAMNPRPPYRLGSGRLRPPDPAPRLGEHPLDAVRSTDDAVSPRTGSRRAGRSGALPFAGLRVLDMTAFWAGPLTGHLLALLGAEVIHLESASRPDGARLVGGVPQTEDRFWERGPIFAALNTNKKSMTIDFSDPRGVDLVRPDGRDL